jgi:hypothetical protein
MGSMDDDADLVGRLLTLAGSTMEDALPVAIVNVSGLSLAERIAIVRVDVDEAAVLLRAAEVLWRRSAGSIG